MLNQWKGAHVLGLKNTLGGRYNSFFCYTKWASVGGLSDLHVRLIIYNNNFYAHGEAL